jgi:type II secretory pathway component GspD/PulD (secretin)
MNTTRIHTLLLCLAVMAGALAASTARAAEEQQAQAVTNGPVAAPADIQQQAPAQPAEQTPVAAEQPVTNTVVPATVPAKLDGIYFNFRGAPLETVLKYLSDATDFVINISPGTDVKGKVDILSTRPLNKDEAFDLLSAVLNQNKLVIVREGRTLTIVNKDNAATSDIPVTTGRDADKIPRTDEMVTHIIQVRYANALQLTSVLQPLLPAYAKLTANESANALVLTATRADVRRMVKIVEALDTSISSISTVRVFPLKYADAKQLADTIQQLFQSPTTQQNNSAMQRFFRNRGGGGGGAGGNAFIAAMGGGGGSTDPSQGTGDNVARQVASRVVAVGDDRTNSLIVGAPDEYIPTIEQLVREVDVSATDVTELRVFHLANADPQELADQLTQLFPDQTKSSQNQNQQFQFGGVRGRGGPGFFGAQTAQASATATSSDRMKRMGQVVAVADNRTSSVLVSAASDLMPQIAEMIAQLDEDASKKQNVYVIPLENAEVSDVLPVLQDMFNKNTSARNNASRATQTGSSALSTRTQNLNQNQGRTTTSGTTGQMGASSTGF